MSIKSQTLTTTIGGQTYVVAPLDAWTGQDAWLRLLKLIAPAMAGLGDAVGDGIRAAVEADGKLVLSDRNIDLTKAMSGVAAALREADPQQVVGYQKELLHSVQCNGKPLPVDAMGVQFIGQPQQLFQLFLFAIKVNFSGFFTDAGGLLSVFAEQAPAAPVE